MPLSSLDPAADRVARWPTVMSCGAAPIFATGARWIFSVCVAVADALALSTTRTFTAMSPGAVYLRLTFGVVVAEHRQAEGRLGYKYVARNQFKSCTCRVGDILVIT